MTYEYACTSCGHRWEAQQSITAAPLTSCPSCGAETARRQVSGGQGFILKGGGWYADLYGSKQTSADTGAKSETKTADATNKSAEPAKTDAASPAPAKESGGTGTKAAAKADG